MLPSAATATEIPGNFTHRVGPNETLWSIGKRYGVPYQQIMRANGLVDASQLSMGRVLVIPGPQVQAPGPLPRIPLSPNGRWHYIVIHHSATPTGNARVFDRSHRRRGFTQGLGYHFLIDNGSAGRRDGQIEIGARWTRQQVGAHCNAGGMNYHGIGICLVGDFTRRQPTSAQMDSLVALVDELRRYYRIPPDHIIRHRDVSGKRTACPGNDFPWAELRRRLAQRAAL